MPNAAALAHLRKVAKLQAIGVGASRRAWAKVSPDQISESWAPEAARLNALLSELQYQVALTASAYSAAALAEQDTYEAPQRFVQARAFAGWVPDISTGTYAIPTDELMLTPPIKAKEYIAAGMGVVEALQRAGAGLDLLMISGLADTGRQAASVDIMARPNVGYIRQLVGTSCPRCVILAGRWYRWNAGFDRHPHCFPAGVVASGPRIEGATRRWYEGELVVFRTASGEELPITGNHPVLTDKGWVPAHLLNVGDNVLRSTLAHGGRSILVPDEQQGPARVEDLWGSNGMVALGQVPSTPEDFHGDGGNGEVDVVLADRLLGYGLQSVAGQGVVQPLLSWGSESSALLDQLSPAEQLALGALGSADSRMGWGRLAASLFSGHLSGANKSGFRHGADLYPGTLQSSANDVAAHMEALREAVLALPGLVGVHDVVNGQDELSPRWDAPSGPLTVQSALGYASRGKDLLLRISGQVEPDRIIEIRRVQFSGHVYSLTSSEGWHVANNLIVSNCDCVHVPAHRGASEKLVTDPYAYFNSLSEAEQNKAWGVASAQAIRDGADISRVTNASRGATKSGIFTTEGMGRRGFAREGLNPRQRRLTPEGIYRMYPKRADALKALQQHGYILPGGQNPLGSIKGAFYEGFGQMGRGGTRKAATQAVLAARESGIRAGDRYAMTAAERRFYDAANDWDKVQRGQNPWTSPGFTQTPDPYGRNLTSSGGPKAPLTPEIAATVEKRYRAAIEQAIRDAQSARRHG